ncbi:MAG TPA: hypothetical protein VG452_03785, partial [Egibacteraceae bacterium]|nr:hypothetical protein [Egibacteraceae bacterium]
MASQPHRTGRSPTSVDEHPGSDRAPAGSPGSLLRGPEDEPAGPAPDEPQAGPAPDEPQAGPPPAGSGSAAAPPRP